MTPAHPPRRKGSKARTWKRYMSIHDDGWLFLHDPCAMEHSGHGEILRVLITEQLPRPGSRRGGRKGKR